MKAIILAAWEGSRLRPLTDTTPKPLIKICWKSIIEYTLEALYKHVKEFIIVVKYKEEVIKNYIWDNYKNVKITYITQNDEKWTWAALKDIQIKWDFLIIYWDSIIEKDDLKKILKSKYYWWLVKEVDNPWIYWIYKQDDEWFAKEIIEKPESFIWNLANLWWFKVNQDLIKYVNEIWKSKRWEIELTCAINKFIANNKFKLITIEWEFIDIGYPWDILDANSYFLEKLKKSHTKWEIEKNVSINWNIVLWKWSILKSWTYIEWNVFIWENTVIWPNTYIRWNTVIWDNSKVWNACEIKNTSIWDHSNVAHLSYIWDSIIWNHVNLWGWFISANLRHNNANIKVPVKDELIDTKRRKFWCIIWDRVHTWINTSTYPWRIIQTDSSTLPGEIVK